MRTKLIPILKREVEKTFGRKIVSSRDCIHLSEEIFNKTEYKINSNTLRRFFGLVKSIYLPSHATLTMLAKYCGFNSLDELNDMKIQEQEGEQIISQSSVLQLLNSLFKEIDTRGNDAICMTIATQVAFFLAKNPQLADSFQRETAKTKFGQEYYFERLVQMDNLNGYYGNGLRYYINEKKTDEAILFGYSLLVFRYWLTMDNTMLEKSFRHLNEHKPEKNSHPHLFGRYFAARLFHAHAIGGTSEEIIAEAQRFHAAFKPEMDEQLFSDFEHLFSEALILTGHYEEGLYYIRYISERLDNMQEPGNNAAFQMNYLLEAIAMSKLGMANEVEQLFGKIRPDQFKPFSKKYGLILYLNLITEFKRRQEGYTLQINSLLEDTGFKRLYNSRRTMNGIYS